MIAAAALFACSAGAMAGEPPTDKIRVAGSHLAIHPQPAYVPTPLRGLHGNAGLAFDLGGSDQRKLQLQLSSPLGLSAFSMAAPGVEGLVLAGSSLNFVVGEHFSLAADGSLSQASSTFTALGSIHCEDGVLNADSYRASNCHFVNGGALPNSEALSLGARYQLDDTVRAGLGLFQESHHVAGAPYWAAPLVTAPFHDPLTSGFGRPAALARQGIDSSLTGIDLEFEVGISTDRAGDMVLGLQLTRVIDAQFHDAWAPALGLNNWTIAEPFDSAGLSLDWNQGNFSGGIQSYYRAPVEFLNRDSLDRYATFDVYFSWRAPWNASVSVGASNVMNAGKKDRDTREGQLADPFESIYGRIPYVRYKQDL